MVSSGYGRVGRVSACRSTRRRSLAELGLGKDVLACPQGQYRDPRAYVSADYREREMETVPESRAAREGLASDIVEELEVKRKFQLARKFVTTTVTYFTVPSKLAHVILGEGEQSLARPVSYFCTSLLIALVLNSVFSTEPEEHTSKINEILDDFIPLFLLLVMIVPGAAIAHLLLRGRGRGRKIRHMVYVQCYAVGIAFLLAGIAGPFGIFNDNAGEIQKLLQLPFALLYGIGVLIAWYLAKVVYEVSLLRLFLAGFVGSLGGSIVVGLFLGGVMAGG